MNRNEPQSSLSFERLVFLSDAVFAIAMTLLVLEIQPPDLDELSEPAIRRALLGLLPKITGFVISFVIVGMLWIEHHRIFRYIAHYDSGLMWRNLLLLLSVSFVPFPTALFSEYYWSQTAFILYTSSFAAVGLLKLWIWEYVRGKRELLVPEMDSRAAQRISRRSLALPIACGAAILLSMISVMIAPLAFAVIPLVARLLDPTRRRVSSAA